jgi:beta-glucanase (GH16 family)
MFSDRIAMLAAGLLLIWDGVCHNTLAAEEGPLGRADEWTSIFADEFDGDALQKKRWTTCYWWDDSGCTNLATNELQWYRRENVAVQDGQLVLVARAEEVVGHKGRAFHYTSGMVTSGRYYAERKRPDRFSFTYGYVEVRAKVAAGQGLWSAVWMLPSDHTSKPEIDVMEVLGHQPSVLEMHYHFKRGDEERNAGHSVGATNLAQDWHVYAVEWAPDAIVWYLDGEEQWRYTRRETISDKPMYLIANLAVGGDWPGSPDATSIFPAMFLIDYIRVWQRGPDG